jgi:acyl-CoA hydrolase
MLHFNFELLLNVMLSDAFSGIFRSNSLFIGANCRQAVNDGRADFTPIFLGEVPLLFRRKILNLDVALIQVSPPDEHGFCTLGPSVDTARAAIQNARYIVGKLSMSW